MSEMKARSQGLSGLKRLLAVVVVMLVFLACYHPQAQAARPAPLLSNHFTLFVGGFFPYIDSNISLDADDAIIPGTEIDFEDDLGMDDTKPTIFGGLRWRITPRHRIEGAYFQLNRDGLATAEGEIRFGDLVIPIGVAVESTLDLGLGRVTYGYSFLNNGKTEVGLLVGAHIASLDTALSLAGVVGDGGSTSGLVVSDEADITAPLPHFGLLGAYAFTPEIVGNARMVGFYLSVGDYKGWLVQGNLDVTWQFAKNFGIGAGVEYFNFSLETDRSDFNGEFSFDYIGPTVFAIATF